MNGLQEFTDANVMMAHYARLKAKMRSLKPPPPPPPPPRIRVIPIINLSPGTIRIRIKYIGTQRQPSVLDIAEYVARRYGLSLQELKSTRRQAPVIHARMVVYYLCRDMTLLSYTTIANHLGGRDHSTVMSGLRRLLARMRDDPDVAMEVAEIEEDAWRVLA